jgi:hypothetical protein
LSAKFTGWPVGAENVAVNVDAEVGVVTVRESCVDESDHDWNTYCPCGDVVAMVWVDPADQANVWAEEYDTPSTVNVNPTGDVVTVTCGSCRIVT